MRLPGWRDRTGRAGDGSAFSEQAVAPPLPVFAFDGEGAHRLAERYWRTVEGATRGLVRVAAGRDGAALRVLGAAPTLMRLGPPRVEASRERISVRYPILAGLLVARAGGELELAQTPTELHALVRGYRPGLPEPLYALQSRFHVHVSRRFFSSLLPGA